MSLLQAAAAVLVWMLLHLAPRQARLIMNESLLTDVAAFFCQLVSLVFLMAALPQQWLPSMEDEVHGARWFLIQGVPLASLLRVAISNNSPKPSPAPFLVGQPVGFVVTLFLLRVTCLWMSAQGLLGDLLLERCVQLSAFAVKSHFLLVILLLLATVLCGRQTCRTRVTLLLVLALRILTISLRSSNSFLTDVADGLFSSMLLADLTLASRAKRDLHPLILTTASVVVAPGLERLTCLLVKFYMVGVLHELSAALDLPILRTCRNVYCDGIYDLCHLGHKNVFQRARALGNRLHVGVVGDADATLYKRPPIMAAAERELEVMGCKGVDVVISNAPCFGLTEEFLRQHQIHVVAYGQEYLDRYPDPEDDPYYKVPRKLGIAVPLPRTEGVSSTDLMDRIVSRAAAEGHHV